MYLSLYIFDTTTCPLAGKPHTPHARKNLLAATNTDHSAAIRLVSWQ